MVQIIAINFRMKIKVIIFIREIIWIFFEESGKIRNFNSFSNSNSYNKIVLKMFFWIFLRKSKSIFKRIFYLNFYSKSFFNLNSIIWIIWIFIFVYKQCFNFNIFHLIYWRFSEKDYQTSDNRCFSIC